MFDSRMAECEAWCTTSLFWITKIWGDWCKTWKRRVISLEMSLFAIKSRYNISICSLVKSMLFWNWCQTILLIPQDTECLKITTSFSSESCSTASSWEISSSWRQVKLDFEVVSSCCVDFVLNSLSKKPIEYIFIKLTVI